MENADKVITAYSGLTIPQAIVLGIFLIVIVITILLGILNLVIIVIPKIILRRSESKWLILSLDFL